MFILSPEKTVKKYYKTGCVHQATAKLFTTITGDLGTDQES